ncbi:MAG: hypothetical protein R3E31_12875 [Chloroflexota bacterium]
MKYTFDGSWDEAQMRTLLQKHTKSIDCAASWALSRVLEIYTGVKPEIDDTNKNLAAYVFGSYPIARAPGKPCYDRAHY